jgi:hypothetical protein
MLDADFGSLILLLGEMYALKVLVAGIRGFWSGAPGRCLHLSGLPWRELGLLLLGPASELILPLLMFPPGLHGALC